MPKTWARWASVCCCLRVPKLRMYLTASQACSPQGWPTHVSVSHIHVQNNQIIKNSLQHSLESVAVMFWSTVWFWIRVFPKPADSSAHPGFITFTKSNCQTFYQVTELFLPLTFLFNTGWLKDLHVQLTWYIYYSIPPNRISSKHNKASLPKNSVQEGFPKQHHSFWWGSVSLSSQSNAAEHIRVSMLHCGIK